MYEDQSFRAAFGTARTAATYPARGLSALDVAGFLMGAASLGGTWSVDRFEDCDGEAVLLLTPRDLAGDALHFSAMRDAAGLRVTEWHGDSHRSLGVFERAQDALGHIWKAVEAEHDAGAGPDIEAFARLLPCGQATPTLQG